MKKQKINIHRLRITTEFLGSALFMASSANKINRLESKLNKLLIINAILIIAIIVVVVYVLWWPQFKLALYGAPFGKTEAGIDTQLTQAQLGVINNAPNSYFETAGERLLNRTLTDEVPLTNATRVNPIIVGGKPSVVYIGAISCIFCGENRWAMALALSRFGNFSALYNGYSSFGDDDVPTLYWKYNNYTEPSGATFGNFYQSNYINFYSIEYDSPINGSFQMQPLSYFIPNAPNSTYASVVAYMNSTGKFQGTPFTLWGGAVVTGADGIVFGNSTPTTSVIPLTNETHAQVLGQLQSFNDQFAWGEYAAADVYIADLCPTIQNSAPVCSLPAIKAIGAVEGLSS
jgi:hypothetical protein